MDFRAYLFFSLSCNGINQLRSEGQSSEASHGLNHRGLALEKALHLLRGQGGGDDLYVTHGRINDHEVE